MGLNSVVVRISAENQWSDPLKINPSRRGSAYFDTSVKLESGTFDATIRVQRSYDNGKNWENMVAFTAPSEDVGRCGSQCLIRIGCKAGEYTSGIILARILK